MAAEADASLDGGDMGLGVTRPPAPLTRVCTGSGGGWSGRCRGCSQPGCAVPKSRHCGAKLGCCGAGLGLASVPLQPRHCCPSLCRRREVRRRDVATPGLLAAAPVLRPQPSGGLGEGWRGLGPPPPGWSQHMDGVGLGIRMVLVSAYGWCWSLQAETLIWGCAGWSPRPCHAPRSTRGAMPPVQGHRGGEASEPWLPGPAPSMCRCCHRAHPSWVPMPSLPTVTPRYLDPPRAAPRRWHPQHPQSAFPRPRQPFPSTDPLHKQRRGRGRVAGMLIYSPPLFSSLHPSGKGLCRYKQTLIKSCLTGNGSSKQQARKLSKSKGSCFCCCCCCLHSQMSLIL